MARKLGILLIAATATAGGLGLAYYDRTTPLAFVGDSFAQATLPKTGVVRVTLDSGIVAAPAIRTRGSGAASGRPARR